MIAVLNIIVRCETDEENLVLKRIENSIGVLRVDIIDRKVVWGEDYE